MLRKDLLAAAAAFGCLMFVSGSASAMTKKECEAAKGTWTQSFGNFGKCVIPITARAPTPDIIDDISKEECVKAGGTVSPDGKDCLIVTKGIRKLDVPKNTN